MHGNRWLALVLVALGAPAVAAPIALTGATLLDLSDFGRSTNDVASATVVIDGDRIVAAGPSAEVVIPAGATRVDVAGRFIAPGLVDGFTAQNNEAQARAHLYMGVTTIWTVEGDSRRGMTIDVERGPSVATLGFAMGYDQSSARDAMTISELRARGRALDGDEMRSFVDVSHWRGMDGLLLYYSMSPAQVAATVPRLAQQGMAAIGELGHTGVLEAARLGVPFFVHFNRALLDVVPDDVRRAVADDPFGEGRTAYMRYLAALDPDSPRLAEFGRAFARERAAIMPTFSLFALSLPGHANPWDEPVAAILDPRDVMLPADRKTGIPEFTFPGEQGLAFLALHQRLARAGVKYVVGSGADAFGALPGIAAHQEMELLVRIGLTPRQALAAATANYPALVAGIDYGVVRAGARADLLVLEADPTKEIRNARRISRIYLRGTEVDRPALLTTPLEVEL